MPPSGSSSRTEGGALRAPASALGVLALTLVCCTHPAAKEDDSLWFAPNMGSTDLLRLFSQPDTWSRARSSVRIFKFYEENLISSSPSDCPLCGPNLLPSLVSQGAFQALGSWGIGIAIETPVVKAWSCDTLLARSRAEEALGSVESNGGSVRFLAMDEPLLGASLCGLNPAQGAVGVAGFASEVQAGRPGLLVGDIEPYPAYSVAALTAWTAALEAEGVRPAFFHLDVDRVEAARLKVNLSADLVALQAFFRTQGIPFGVILWGQGPSDTEYYDDVSSWAQTVSGSLGRPPQLVFQSWAAGAGGSRRIPDNLPESDPTIYSHTRLLNDALGVFPP